MSQSTAVTFEHEGRTVQIVRHKPGGKRKPGYTQLQVSSASDPTGPAHEVVADADGARCDCRGFRFKKRCSHGDIALALRAVLGN